MRLGDFHIILIYGWGGKAYAQKGYLSKRCPPFAGGQRMERILKFKLLQIWDMRLILKQNVFKASSLRSF
jgi:hypothetical protein